MLRCRNAILVFSYFFLGSFAHADPVQFDLNAMSDVMRTQLIVELAAANGADKEYMAEQIPGPSAMQMDEFQYKRFYDAEVKTINDAPTLWNAGETVKLSYHAVALLERYDFDSGTYAVCVPAMFVPKVGWVDNGRSVIPPNILLTFSPINSSATETAPAGQRCHADQTFWDQVGEGIGDFNTVNLKMSADDAETLHNSAVSSSFGGGFIEFSVSCIVGPGEAGSQFGWRRTNGADCSVEAGFVKSGGKQYNFEYYNAAEERTAAEAAAQEAEAAAAVAEADRVSQLPAPEVRDCKSSGFAVWAKNFPNCKIVVFSDGGTEHVRMVQGSTNGRYHCQYVEPESSRDVKWEWIEVDGVNGVRITPTGQNLPTSVAVFEMAVGETYSGFTCGFVSIKEHKSGQQEFEMLKEGLGNVVWGGKIVQYGSFPDPVQLSIENGEIIWIRDGGCRYRWIVGGEAEYSGELREISDGPYCNSGANVRVEFWNKSQLNVEWRNFSKDSEPRAWAVLQPPPG